MNAQSEPVPWQTCRKPCFPARPDFHANTQRRARKEATTQLIYAHFPPAAVLAAEQHLRAQTQIEQRAQQLWFARGRRPESALGDWLQAERELVQELCAALQHQNPRELEAAPAFH